MLLDWSQCDAVESVPGKVSGAWLVRVRGTDEFSIVVLETSLTPLV